MKLTALAHQHLKRQPFWFVVVTVAAASSISLLGGVGLELSQEKLLPLIPLIIALPALNTMVGDYATVIAAHAGDPNERPRTRRQLIRSIAISVLINIIGVVVLSSLLALRRDYSFTALLFVKFSIFVALAVSGIVVFMFLITLLIDKILDKHRLNPDDILIPVVTSISDVFMLVSVALTANFLF